MKKDLRKDILRSLYEQWNVDHTRKIDRESLCHKLDITWERVQSEIAYLENKGYITSEKRGINNRILHTFCITASGIDEIEGHKNSKPIWVSGDYIDIDVGQNAQNIAVGKGVVANQSVTSTQKTFEALISALDDFSNHIDLDSNDELEENYATALRSQILQLKQLLLNIKLTV